MSIIACSSAASERSTAAVGPFVQVPPEMFAWVEEPPPPAEATRVALSPPT